MKLTNILREIEGEEDGMPNAEPSDEMPMLEDEGADSEGGMEGLRDTLDMESEDEAMPDLAPGDPPRRVRARLSLAARF